MLHKIFRTPKDSAPVDEPTDDSGPQYLGQLPIGVPIGASASRSGRVIASYNELAVLQALLKFGWLTSRQLAAWVWAENSQQVQMARRTLTRLKHLNQVITRTLPNGVPAYVLSNAGAARLREQGLEARSGKDHSLLRWEHRAICNWHTIIMQQAHGDMVYSEHEIYTQRAPIRDWCGKIPDSLLCQAGLFKWVEVEHSRRRPSDMGKILDLLVNGPLHPAYAYDLELLSIDLVTTDRRLANAIAARLKKKIDDLHLTDEQRHKIHRRTHAYVLTLTPGLILESYPIWCVPLIENPYRKDLD